MAGRVPPVDSRSRFQVSLRQILLWVTAVSVVCGLAHGLIAYLRYVEAKNGAIPRQTVGLILFFGYIILASFAGLMIGPPLCYVLALWRSRRRDETIPPE
jgi:uncharacterized membrane protein YbhN (UPF0104 family)